MKSHCGCPKLDKEDWDLKKHSWKRRGFYRTKHGLFFHTPIGVGKAIKKGMAGIEEGKYTFKFPCENLRKRGR